MRVSLWFLWCVNDFITAGSKMTLRQSLYPGGVQLSWKYEQRRRFTFSNFGVTLGKVIKFQVEEISFRGFSLLLNIVVGHCLTLKDNTRVKKAYRAVKKYWSPF